MVGLPSETAREQETVNRSPIHDFPIRGTQEYTKWMQEKDGPNLPVSPDMGSEDKHWASLGQKRGQDSGHKNPLEDTQQVNHTGVARKEERRSRRKQKTLVRTFEAKFR